LVAQRFRRLRYGCSSHLLGSGRPYKAHRRGGTNRPLLGNKAKLSANGNVVAGDNRSWKQACAACLPPASLRMATASGLAGCGVHGCCPVEVDVETGKIRPHKDGADRGLPLNRLTMESQINGGMIQSSAWPFWKVA
jgi:CO/xanthine dehydrogenase Mo-binding subunit